MNPEAEEEADFSACVAIIQIGLTELEAGDRGILLEDYRSKPQTAKTPL